MKIVNRELWENAYFQFNVKYLIIVKTSALNKTSGWFIEDN